MSLINEALRKARLEAARQDAAGRGISYPTIARERRRPPLAPILTAVILLAAAGGIFYWLGTRSAREGVEIGEARETAAMAPAEPVAGKATAPARVTTEPSATAPAAVPPSETVPAPRDPAPAPVETRSRPAPPVPDPRPEPAATAEPIARSTPPATIPADPTPAPVETEPETAEPIEPPAAPADTPVTPSTAATEPPPETAAPVSETFVREASIPGIGQLRLGGIAWSERQPFALINGRVVGPGDRIQGLQVAAVNRGEVVLRAEGGARYVLRLR